jgi:hypothetical protein
VVRGTSENSFCTTKVVLKYLEKGKQQRTGTQTFSMVRIITNELEMYKCCIILEYGIRLLGVSDLGVRPVGYGIGDTFVKVPEMIPELIVPDLTGFQVILKYKLIEVRLENIIRIVFVYTVRRFPRCF